MSTTPTRIDVITAEIVRNGMIAAAHEMAQTFVRASYSPLYYELKDFGVGIVSASGQLWGEDPGLAVFVGCLSDTIKTGIETIGADGFAEGDVVLANDPFLTGTHVADTSIYLPIFNDGELIAFAIGTAHWADIGGKTPTGWSPDSTDVYQEGICFPHVKLFHAGCRDQDLWRLIESNVRFADTIMHDLEANLAACRQGVARVQQLCRRYGNESVRRSMELVIERTDQAVRTQIAAIPDGHYTASSMLDDDGVDATKPFPVCVGVEVHGDSITVSYDGTSETRSGPVNITEIGAKAAARVALKALTLPNDPSNEGHFLALGFRLKPGLAVTASRPAPTDSYGYLVVTTGELIIRALAQAVPERCPAGGSQFMGVFLSRVDPRDGSPFIFIDAVAGGTGGRPTGAGQILAVLGNGDVPNLPVEVLENRYPLRCERRVLDPEQAGAGAFRGGFGVHQDIRINESGLRLVTAIESTRDPISRGLGGGLDGRPGYVVARRGGAKPETIRGKVSYHGPYGPGDVLSIHGPGGGGWGNPVDRDPQAVLRDVRDGLLSQRTALDIYGVVVDGGDDPAIDFSATEEVRNRLRRRR